MTKHFIHTVVRLKKLDFFLSHNNPEAQNFGNFEKKLQLLSKICIITEQVDHNIYKRITIGRSGNEKFNL